MRFNKIHFRTIIYLLSQNSIPYFKCGVHRHRRNRPWLGQGRARQQRHSNCRKNCLCIVRTGMHQSGQPAPAVFPIKSFSSSHRTMTLVNTTDCWLLSTTNRRNSFGPCHGRGHSRSRNSLTFTTTITTAATGTGSSLVKGPTTQRPRDALTTRKPLGRLQERKERRRLEGRAHRRGDPKPRNAAWKRRLGTRSRPGNGRKELHREGRYSAFRRILSGGRREQSIGRIVDEILRGIAGIRGRPGRRVGV